MQRARKHDLLFLLHLSCYVSSILDHQLNFQIQFIPEEFPMLCVGILPCLIHLIFDPGDSTRQKHVLAFKIKYCWLESSTSCDVNKHHSCFTALQCRL